MKREWNETNVALVTRATSSSALVRSMSRISRCLVVLIIFFHANRANVILPRRSRLFISIVAKIADFSNALVRNPIDLIGSLRSSEKLPSAFVRQASSIFLFKDKLSAYSIRPQESLFA